MGGAVITGARTRVLDAWCAMDPLRWVVRAAGLDADRLEHDALTAGAMPDEIRVVHVIRTQPFRIETRLA